MSRIASDSVSEAVCIWNYGLILERVVMRSFPIFYVQLRVRFRTNNHVRFN